MKDKTQSPDSGPAEAGEVALPPDRMNLVGVLTRREIEARILAPLLKAFEAELGRERVVEILRQTIINLAQEQGEQLAHGQGGDSLAHFADSLKYWVKDDALQIEVLAQSDEVFDFNVTRCRYAEMYRELGIPELGALLSCNRDFALIQGFNPDVALTRTQTIMEGATHCDFRYVLGGLTGRQQVRSKPTAPQGKQS